MDIADHPDIASALRTGYPCGSIENQDTQEARVDFAKENFDDFLAYALDGDPDLLENFCEHYPVAYRDFLN